MIQGLSVALKPILELGLVDRAVDLEFTENYLSLTPKYWDKWYEQSPPGNHEDFAIKSHIAFFFPTQFNKFPFPLARTYKLVLVAGWLSKHEIPAFLKLIS